MSTELQTFITVAGLTLLGFMIMIFGIATIYTNKKYLEKEKRSKEEIEGITRTLNYIGVGAIFLLLLPLLFKLILISPLGVLVGFLLWRYTHDKTTRFIFESTNSYFALLHSIKAFVKKFLKRN